MRRSARWPWSAPTQRWARRQSSRAACWSATTPESAPSPLSIRRQCGRQLGGRPWRLPGDGQRGAQRAHDRRGGHGRCRCGRDPRRARGDPGAGYSRAPLRGPMSGAQKQWSVARLREAFGAGATVPIPPSKTWRGASSPSTVAPPRSRRGSTNLPRGGEPSRVICVTRCGPWRRTRSATGTCWKRPGRTPSTAWPGPKRRR